MRPDRFSQSDGRDFVESRARDREHPYLGDALIGLSQSFKWTGWPPFDQDFNAKTVEGFKMYRIATVAESYTGQNFSASRTTKYECTKFEVPVITVLSESGSALDFQRATAFVDSLQFPETFTAPTERRFEARSGNTVYGTASIVLSGARYSFAEIYETARDAFRARNDFTAGIFPFENHPASIAVNPSPARVVDFPSAGYEIRTGMEGFHFAFTYSLGFVKVLLAALSNTFKQWDVENNVFSGATFHEIACGVKPGVEVIEPPDIVEGDLPSNENQWIIRDRFAFPPHTSVGATVGTLRPSCAPEITS